MSHLTAAGATQGALFSCGERREVVVQQELLILTYEGAVDQLLVELGSQGQCGQALRFTTCEDGRSVTTGEVIHFCPDGTDLCGLPAVEAKAFVQNEVANGFLLRRLDVVAGQATLLGLLLVAHGGHERFFQLRETRLALFLGGASLARFVEFGVHLLLDATAQLFVVGFVVVLALVAEGADFLGELILGFALGFDGFVCFFDGVHHLTFAHFLHLAFHHHNAVHGAGHHDVHVGDFQLRAQGVDDELSVDAGHADFRHRSIKRNV